MWCVVCGMWYVVCGVWCVVCGMWCVVCGMWYVVCGVWYVVCSVWCCCVVIGFRSCSAVSKALTADTSDNMMQISIVLAVKVAI